MGKPELLHQGQTLLDLVPFYDGITALMNKGRATGISYLNFNKVFDMDR